MAQIRDFVRCRRRQGMPDLPERSAEQQVGKPRAGKSAKGYTGRRKMEMPYSCMVV